MITNYLMVAFEGLKTLRLIHKSRVLAYEQAEKKACVAEMKDYLSQVIRESRSFGKDLENFLAEIEGELGNSKPEEESRIHQSQFYYAVAKSQSNSPTVFLSCLLGDSHSLKAYQDLLSYHNIGLFPRIKQKLEQQFKKIREQIEKVEIFQVSTDFGLYFRPS